MRSSRARLESMAEEGAPRCSAGAQADRRHRRLHRGLPGRDHDRLDRHRCPRRAGDRARVRAAVRQGHRACRGGGRVGGDLLPADHGHPEHHRRDRPEALHDPARRGSGQADRAADAVLPVLVQPVHHRAELRVGVDPADARHRPRRRARGRHARRAQAPDRPVPLGRPARRRRGQHAHGRLSPARAGGPPGDDPDPGCRHRRPVGDRRGGAPALRLDRPLAAGRDRGREPGPGQGDRPRQPARQEDAQ